MAAAPLQGCVGYLPQLVDRQATGLRLFLTLMRNWGRSQTGLQTHKAPLQQQQQQRWWLSTAGRPIMLLLCMPLVRCLCSVQCWRGWTAVLTSSGLVHLPDLSLSFSAGDLLGVLM